MLIPSKKTQNYGLSVQDLILTQKLMLIPSQKTQNYGILRQDLILAQKLMLSHDRKQIVMGLTNLLARNNSGQYLWWNINNSSIWIYQSKSVFS